LISNTKIVLADAQSTDRTVAIAREFGDRLSICVIEGGLPSVGRNNGARCAASRYILFVDADIELAEPTLLRRAMDRIKKKSLDCITTDLLCRDGVLLDRLLYGCNNLVQRLSRFHRPFATGMFMLIAKERFDAIGGFDEQALYAEDYQLTRQIPRNRFGVLRGGIYSTNRRFMKMGHAAIVRFFLTTAIHSRRPEYFRSKLHRAYWEAY
jgi:glycosyltransferase involved in cell wall biosynthesis